MSIFFKQLYRQKVSTVAFLITYVIIGASLIGNLLVVVVIDKSKELRHSQFIYKSSIVFSDVVLGSCLSYLIISESVTTILKNSFAAVTLNHSQ